MSDLPDRTALPAAVHAAVAGLSARLRSLPQSRLQAGAAAQGLELARWLARRAQQLEFPEREPHEIPDDGVFAVGDQLAVAGHDLLRAAATEPGGSGSPGRPGSPEGSAREADAVLDEALERVGRVTRAVG